MKDFFRDIFEYHNHFNQRLIEQLMDNENSLTQRTFPIISHTINAHQIWNARIIDKDKVSVHAVHSLAECRRMDNANYSETLVIIDNYDLDKVIHYSNSKGTEFKNTIYQILYHIANHFSHHKGQIISDLRQSGIEPIVTDYIFYKR